MQPTTIGLDIAKSVFQVHGVDAEGKTVVRRKLRRGEVVAFFAKLPPCLVGLEACGGAHYWAREIGKLGHDVRLIPPADVKAYVRRDKSDAIDAEAVCEAVGRPRTRNVPVKTVEQQAMRALHKSRALLIRQRTMAINALRAHLGEHGLVSAKGEAGRARLEEMLGQAVDLPAALMLAADALIAQIDALDEQVGVLDRALAKACKDDPEASRLKTVPGVGPVGATAFAASVSDIKLFAGPRDFAAWLGLAPSRRGTGGKTTLGPITKKGDRYLRSLLVAGATALLARPDSLAPAHRAWLEKKKAEKSSARLVTVALANKLARILWALMSKGEVYDKRRGAEPERAAP
jgi:transposase